MAAILDFGGHFEFFRGKREVYQIVGQKEIICQLWRLHEKTNDFAVI